MVDFDSKLAVLRNKIRQSSHASSRLDGTSPAIPSGFGGQQQYLYDDSKVGGAGTVMNKNYTAAPQRPPYAPFSAPLNKSFSSTAPLPAPTQNTNMMGPAYSSGGVAMPPLTTVMDSGSSALQDPLMTMNFMMASYSNRVKQLKSKNQMLRSRIRSVRQKQITQRAMQQQQQQQPSTEYYQEDGDGDHVGGEGDFAMGGSKYARRLDAMMAKIEELHHHVKYQVPAVVPNHQQQQLLFQRPTHEVSHHTPTPPPQYQKSTIEPTNIKKVSISGATHSAPPRELQREQESEREGGEMEKERERELNSSNQKLPSQAKEATKSKLSTAEKPAFAPSSIASIARTQLAKQPDENDAELFDDLDKMLGNNMDDDEDDDDEDSDDDELDEAGKKKMSASRLAKIERKKKQESLRKQHEGKNYDECIKPMYRYISMGLPIPVDRDGKYKVLKGKSLFRAVVWHVLSFYAAPKLAMIKHKLETKAAEKKGFESVLKFCFEQTRSWLNKEVKLSVTSILIDQDLDLDVHEQTARGLGGFTRFFGIGGKKDTKEERLANRMMKLKIRVKGVIKSLTRDLPIDTIMNFFKTYFTEGNYFPDQFLLSCELDKIDLNDVGGTKRIKDDRNLVKLMFVNFVIVRILIGHVLQYPWCGGLGRIPKEGSNAAQNLQCLATLVYRITRMVLPEGYGLPGVTEDKLETKWKGIEEEEVDNTENVEESDDSSDSDSDSDSDNDNGSDSDNDNEESKNEKSKKKKKKKKKGENDDEDEDDAEEEEEDEDGKKKEKQNKNKKKKKSGGKEGDNDK